MSPFEGKGLRISLLHRWWVGNLKAGYTALATLALVLIKKLETQCLTQCQHCKKQEEVPLALSGAEAELVKNKVRP